MLDIDQRPLGIGPNRSLISGVGSRFPTLNGMRGAAVMLVLFYHFTLGFPRRSIEPGSLHGLLAQLANVSWCGVDLFFVLSGFLITGILIDSKGTPNYFRNFYMRRVLRIVPLYYGLLLVLFVITPHFHAFAPSVRSHLREQEWLWFYAGNFYEMSTANSLMRTFHVQHLWSLAVEEQFYVIWPLVIFMARAKTAARISVFCIAAALVLRILLWEKHVDPEAIWNLTFCRMDGLAVGALCALLVRRAASRRYLFSAARIAAVVSIVGLLAILWWRRTWSWDDPVMETLGISLLGVFFGGLLILSLNSEGSRWVSWVLRRPTLATFGFYSYALYVFHYPLMVVDNRLFPIAPLSVHLHSLALAVGVYGLASTALSFAMAWLSWHCYEKHFMKLKDRFALPMRPAPVPVPQASQPALA